MNRRTNLAIILLSLVCLLVAGCTVIALEAYAQAFDRVESLKDDELYACYTWNDINQDRYPREEVRFTSGSGGDKLQGFIYGSMNTTGLIVISHGLGGTADHYLSLIMYFVDRGWRVFVYNNTGVAGSEGESMRGLGQAVVDLDSALAFVKNSKLFDGLPVMLAGHSLGGYAVCAALNLNQNVNAVVSFSGFNSSREIFEEQAITLIGGLYYILSPQTWAIEKQLFGDIANLTAVNGINKAGIPVMLVHSSDDEVIPTDTTAIFAHRKKITNPAVEIVFLEGENASGHATVYCSKAAIEYMTRWKGEVNFDKARANELNGALMERINAFFAAAL
jgi:alpha-beta hydrolase superfamily lysophospholipase